MAKDKRKDNRGRPSKRTPEIDRRIIEGLSDGIPLAVLCREDGMPAPRTVYDWTGKDEAFSAEFRRARDAGYDVIASNCMDIADKVTEDPASRRVRVETRLKLLAKWDPRRYGDKVQHTGGDGESAISITIRDMTKE